MTEAESHVVHVSTASVRAYSTPSFIIKFGDKYYTTLAVLEYDPHAPGITETQKRDIDEVAKLYERLHVHGTGGGAVNIGQTPTAQFIQSGPHR